LRFAARLFLIANSSKLLDPQLLWSQSLPLRLFDKREKAEKSACFPGFLRPPGKPFSFPVARFAGNADPALGLRRIALPCAGASPARMAW
jgi:hypothetical protein